MLLSTLSAYVLIGPRVVFAMAQAGQFPAVAARLTRAGGHARGRDGASGRRRPGPALDRARQESIIVYAGVGLSIFSMLAMSSIYVLRWRRPDLPRPFRTPGYPRHSGRLPLPDRAAHGGDVSRSSPGLLLCAFEHPGRHSVLLHLADRRRPGTDLNRQSGRAGAVRAPTARTQIVRQFFGRVPVRFPDERVSH